MTILEARLTRPLRGGASFPIGHRLYRALWQCVWMLGAAWTPPPCRRWRRFVLRMFGARMGRGADVRGSARVWYPPHLTMADWAVLGPGVNCYNQASISIGTEAVISQGAQLCTGSHDISDPDFQLIARPIHIGRQAWVAADAFVGPGVTIGEGAVLGARGVAFHDLPAWTVYRGNPAKPVRLRHLRGANSRGNDVGNSRQPLQNHEQA